MLNFLQHKLLNKKWLNACLLLGIVLLIAVMSCTPMFKNGALDMMLSTKFGDKIEETNNYSCVLGREGSCDTEKYPDMASIMDRTEKYHKTWFSYVDTKVLADEAKYYIDGGFATATSGKKDSYKLAYMPGIEDHIKIVHGKGLEESDMVDGAYPAIITEEMADENNLTVGETVTYDKILDSSEKPLKFYIAGIFSEKDYSDYYWYIRKSEFTKQGIVSLDAFDEIISKYSIPTVYSTDYNMLDYSDITHKNASDIKYYVEEFIKADDHIVQNFTDVIKSYENDAKTIGIIIWVLELPILVLLLAFIYMVSSQILEMEEGEIAMLKSRGTSTRQIIRIYIGQSAILSLVALFIGIPMGYGLCKLAASSNSFLEFRSDRTCFYGMTASAFIYSLVAAVIAILFVTMPVFKYARNSIVEQKRKSGKINVKPFWEKCFLDVIFAAVSIYLLYNYRKQRGTIALDILAGKRPDPLIFLNSSLFIFAVGLVILRLIKYLIRFIYFLGRKKWKPALYASFLQITRTSKKQGFISVFLVMTIAMGIFNSNMARTINDNNRNREAYNAGTDLRVSEHWSMGIYHDKDKNSNWYYEEPDFERFTGYEGSLYDMATRVIYDDGASISVGGETLDNNILMGIHTKEFGETASLQSGLNKEHWYNYLNALAQTSNGVIISSNLAKKYSLAVGDSISYTRYNPIKSKADEPIATVSGNVVAIVDAWPGFEQYSYEKDEEGNITEVEKYLVVANYAYVVGAFGQTPYEVWIKTNSDKDYKAVLDQLEDDGIKISSYISKDKNTAKLMDSSLVVITNGLFSLSFIVAVVLCLVGFLIYWITSIKQRELLFGIYRAMGMSMKEINKMLINEQIFSSVLASLAGYGVGALTTMLFVKLIAIVYLPETHNIPIALAVNPMDIIKLTAVVVVMFIACFIVIRTILKKMNITQALKLGED